MALRAVLSELILMHIQVTIGALTESKTLKKLHFLPILVGKLVTEFAVDLGMFTKQFETCLRMIKVSSRFKRIVIVAGSAIA